VCCTIIKMEIIKVEIEDMSDQETSEIKHEDTEEQIGWFILILHCLLLRNVKVTKLQFNRLGD